MHVRAFFGLIFVTLFSIATFASDKTNTPESKGTVCITQGPYHSANKIPKLNADRIIQEATHAATSLKYNVEIRTDWSCLHSIENDNSCLITSDQCDVSMYIAIEELNPSKTNDEMYRYKLVTLNLETVYSSVDLVDEPLKDGNFWEKLEYGVQHAIARSSSSVKKTIEFENDQEKTNYNVDQNLLDKFEHTQQKKKLQSKINRLLGWSIGVGSVALISGGLSLSTYAAGKSKFDNEKEKELIFVNADYLDAAINLKKASTVLAVVSGAAAVGTVILAVLLAKKVKEKKKIAMTAVPIAAHSGAMFVLGVAF